jgi:hypothetical protein
MPAIHLNGEGFVGITDARRRAIYEAEKSAAAMGVLPDDPEKRSAIIERLTRRLAVRGVGWDLNLPETAVRVDEQGVARIIPKREAAGWQPGLPASPDSRDASSGTAQVGRTRPHREQVSFPDPGEITPVDPRTAAQRFHQRIRDEMARTGYIPKALRVELAAEGWKLGQPISLQKVEEWCNRFQIEHGNKYPRR